MKTDNNKLIVSAIENGTVLDHIPSSQIFRVLDILNLYATEQPITIGMNLNSKLMDKKGIIKISNIFFEDNDINKIALIAPHASINIIKNYKVVDKKVISIPEHVNGIVKCDNPVCVTNHQEIETKFKTVVRKNGETELICHYCGKATALKSLKILSKQN
ncbi:MAG: aspartate carbamoyltransferase regulatory subunit [Bacteroidales bacterium]